jgi:hypothetical protein
MQSVGFGSSPFFSLQFPLQFFYVSISLIISSLSSSLIYFLFLISLSSHSQNKKIGEGIGENQRRGSKSHVSNLAHSSQITEKKLDFQLYMTRGELA